ncbi:hypothetical protein GCG21_08775 [Pseudactinotalea sp. HY160]|uniref:hypothetical protein n=1 Tax=Pseudactinotalea sp. HY160 TaxID=2654490 RepID=UPI00128E2D6E|nr:hypothetical protein [Pseudactinotalea sp. HY160]MPV50098.1 hypothetical protein [Pseudactinotalea sp. HY160]
MTRRIYSRDPAHLGEDLAASLTVALGLDATPGQRQRVAELVDSVGEYRDSQQVLRDVLAEFGSAVFGIVVRFHQEAKTSLMGQSESLTGSLPRLGLTIRDLNWPIDVLHPNYSGDAAPPNPALEARLAAAVTAWQADHPEQQEAPTGSPLEEGLSPLEAARRRAEAAEDEVRELRAQLDVETTHKSGQCDVCEHMEYEQMKLDVEKAWAAEDLMKAELDNLTAKVDQARAIVAEHHAWQIRRAAKFGRTGGDCQCEQCQIANVLAPSRAKAGTGQPDG